MGISPKDFQNTLNKYSDFHRLYLFKVAFFNNPSANGTQDHPRFITELIASSETPVSTSTQLSVGWMGSKVKVAGKTDYQDWKVSVRDDLTNLAYGYFQQWREEVYDLQNGSSESLQDVGYKRKAMVQLLTNTATTSNTNQKTSRQRVYTIHGIWPKDIGAIVLDYSTENIATFPVTFSIDYFTYEEMSSAGFSSVQIR